MSTIHKLHHAAIEAGLSTGLLNRQPTLTVDGHTARFHADDWTEWYRARTAMGERAVLRQVIERVAPGDVLWDVGAAVGTYACLAAVAGATVVAIEPHPDAAARLRENAALNDCADSIDVRECALADQEGETHLQPAGDAANGSHQVSESGIPVPMRRGDELGAPDPDVLKIDVEGHEGLVLDGLGARLGDARVCLAECHADGPDVARVRERLEGAGFAVEAVGDREGVEHLLGVSG